MTTTDTAGNPKLCCDQPPRLLQGEGLGYAFMCMECGKGLFSNFRGPTYQTAAYLWETKSPHLSAPLPHGGIAAVAMALLNELNDAHDVLRNLAYTLGVGGYNATNVDAKLFGAKIRDGIDMLTKPLTDQIETLRKEKDALLHRVADEVLSGWRKDDQISQNKEAVVAEMTFEGCSYAFKKNGMVDVVILKSGRGFTRHIHSVGLPVQQALEKQLKEKGI